MHASWRIILNCYHYHPQSPAQPETSLGRSGRYIPLSFSFFFHMVSSNSFIHSQIRTHLGIMPGHLANLEMIALIIPIALATLITLTTPTKSSRYGGWSSSHDFTQSPHTTNQELPGQRASAPASNASATPTALPRMPQVRSSLAIHSGLVSMSCCSGTTSSRGDI